MSVGWREAFHDYNEPGALVVCYIGQTLTVSGRYSVSRNVGPTIMLATCLILSGCSTLRAYTMPPEKNLISGAGSLFTKDGEAAKFEALDVNVLLQEYGLANVKLLDRAEWNDPASRSAYLRNELQDRIIAASNQRCGYYLREIVSAKSQSQMGWGALSLLLSGAASVTTPIKAAQSLAAGGAAATGINTLYSESYFNNLAVTVIASGITKQREGVLDQIKKLRKDSLLNYPVNKAIADAITYHASCNILTGLETAANALKLAPGTPTLTTSPGMDAGAGTSAPNPATQAPSANPQVSPAVPSSTRIPAAPIVQDPPRISPGTSVPEGPKDVPGSSQKI